MRNLGWLNRITVDILGFFRRRLEIDGINVLRIDIVEGG